MCTQAHINIVEVYPYKSKYLDVSPMPNQDDEEEYEKYCYAKMILHHPFKKLKTMHLGRTHLKPVIRPGKLHTIQHVQVIQLINTFAYMKFIKDNPGRRPAPLHINVDNTAGTGNSWLICLITKAVRELFPDQNDLVA